MTSYLVVRKSHLQCFNDIFYAWNVFAIDFIDEQPGTDTHSIKILLCGLADDEVLPPDEANVSEDFTVPLRYFTISCWQSSDKVMKHSKVTLSSICA